MPSAFPPGPLTGFLQWLLVSCASLPESVLCPRRLEVLSPRNDPQSLRGRSLWIKSSASPPLQRTILSCIPCASRRVCGRIPLGPDGHSSSTSPYWLSSLSVSHPFFLCRTSWAHPSNYCTQTSVSESAFRRTPKEDISPSPPPCTHMASLSPGAMLATRVTLHEYKVSFLLRSFQ